MVTASVVTAAPPPRKLRPSWRSLAKLVVIGTSVTAALVAALIVQKGYGWHEMDWNDDGSVSITELLEAIDSDKHAVATPQGICNDYIRYKDQTLLIRRCAPVAGQPASPAS
jgi:hypothetical protein